MIWYDMVGYDMVGYDVVSSRLTGVVLEESSLGNTEMTHWGSVSNFIDGKTSCGKVGCNMRCMMMNVCYMLHAVC